MKVLSMPLDFVLILNPYRLNAFNGINSVLYGVSYSTDFFNNLFCRSHERKLEKYCENIQLANRNLFPFMAGADIGFNNNISGIASRVTMEMMALGIPVVSYNGDYTKFHAKPFDLHSIALQVKRCWKELNAEGSTLRAETIQYAKDNFDRGKHVKEYIKLYERLIG